MKKRKQADISRILDLLGVDPDEIVPNNFKDAKLLYVEENEKLPTNKEKRKCHETGKMMYLSENMAKQAARSRLNRGSNVSKIRCYLCEHCHHWHMSSSFH